MTIRAVFAAALAAASVSPAVADAAEPTTPFCYVATGGVNQTLVLADDASSSTSLATLPFAGAVAISPDDRLALVADPATGTVAFVDTATSAVVARVSVGASPTAVAFGPRAATAYVASAGSKTLSVIDVATRTVTATVALPTAPTAVAVSTDGADVFVARSGAVTRIDARTNTVRETLGSDLVGSAPSRLAATGGTLYVGGADASLAVVRLSGSGPQSSSVKLAGVPTDIAVTPDGASLLVAESASSAVELVSTATNAVTRTALSVTSPAAVAVSADGTRAWVAGASATSVFSLRDGTLLKAVPLGTGASSLDVACSMQSAFAPLQGFSPAVEVRLRDGRLTARGSFSPAVSSNGLDPAKEAFKLTLDAFSLQLPAGALAPDGGGRFAFEGTIAGADVRVRLETAGTGYQFEVEARGADVSGVNNPTAAQLTIGDDQGNATVPAQIRQ